MIHFAPPRRAADQVPHHAASALKPSAYLQLRRVASGMTPRDVGARIAGSNDDLPSAIALVALLVAAIANSLAPDFLFPIWWIVTPYVVLSIGLRSTRGIRRTGRWGDFSYGLYLYAFPVQQTFIWLWPLLPLAVSAIGTLVVSFLAAALSWHLVENQALRLKPGRPNSWLRSTT